MYLKSLEIQGFKSFASKVLLEFEPGITSVVGPNGSGKSNIADSLRWVFGEQSMKLLRSKKAEDVIFAGSDQKARLGACEVSVFFDNSDHKMPIAYEEVVIGRRLYRNGNSEYLINGTQVRLLDIQELLLKSGFGNTSYCVIGQGMIDQLILGGPAAIKEMIEEASGIKPYYIKREKTLRRLERTENNLAQVKALVSEIEPRLRSLRRQAKKLERRTEIETELKETQILYFAQILDSLENQLQSIKNKESVFDKQISELNQEVATLSKDVEGEEKNLVSGSSDYKKLQQELAALYKQKQELMEKKIKFQGQISELKQRGSKVNANWAEIKSKFKIAYERLKTFLKNLGSASREDLSTELKEVETLFAQVWSDLESGEEKSQNSSEQERMGGEIKKVESQIETLSSKIAETESKQQSALEAEQLQKSQLFVKDRLLRNKQEILVKTRDAKNQLAVEAARLSTRKETHEGEARVELGPSFLRLLEEAKAKPVPMGLMEKVQNLKKQLMDIGGVDDLIQKEYQETEERYQYLTTQSADLEKAVRDLRSVIAELDEIIKKQFSEAFNKISEKFVEYFKMLFNGGKAAMALVRAKPSVEEQIEEESSDVGIREAKDSRGALAPSGGQENDKDGRGEIAGAEIKATPPGKRLAGISALSGGERALTSIALLCALLSAYPSPFVVLDEVDAALDEANSVRFGKILGTLAHKTQFITITHNRETMRQSHTLYGVTMREDGVSKILFLKLQEAAVYSSKN